MSPPGRCLLLLALLAAACAPIAPPAHQPTSPLPHRIYLPSVSVPAPSCYRTPQAAAFAQLLTADARQQRGALDCHPALVIAAEARARSLAAGGYWSHCDPTGICPNAVALWAGCRLPPDYPRNGNSIESIAAGSPDMRAILDALARSPLHAPHVFGATSFFRPQDRIGVAYLDAPGSRWRWYWVILIARCEGVTSGE